VRTSPSKKDFTLSLGYRIRVITYNSTSFRPDGKAAQDSHNGECNSHEIDIISLAYDDRCERAAASTACLERRTATIAAITAATPTSPPKGDPV
jgi:hypothetical protein